MQNTLILKLAAAISAAVLSSPAISQRMYKCGNTYSQIPCDKNAEPARVFSDAKADPPVGLRGKDLCKAAVPKSVNLKDPYSARVETVGGPTFEVVTFANQPLTVKRYDVAVNAKNSYGAYTGIKLYKCLLTEDDGRVFDIVSPPEK